MPCTVKYDLHTRRRRHLFRGDTKSHPLSRNRNKKRRFTTGTPSSGSTNTPTINPPSPLHLSEGFHTSRGLNTRDRTARMLLHTSTSSGTHCSRVVHLARRLLRCSETSAQRLASSPPSMPWPFAGGEPSDRASLSTLSAFTDVTNKLQIKKNAQLCLDSVWAFKSQEEMGKITDAGCVRRCMHTNPRKSSLILRGIFLRP